MDRIYKYNSDTSDKPNGGIYLQLITAKDLYIQNITVAEHDGNSDSFQVKFPNVFTNYPLGAVRAEDQKFKDYYLAIAIEFRGILCMKCLWCIC